MLTNAMGSQVIANFRVQKNVSVVSILPQWDLQNESPNQSIFSEVPYVQLSGRAYSTTPKSVSKEFVPPFICLLVCIRKANALSESDLEMFAQSMVLIYRYFQIYDWDLTWAATEVRKTCLTLN